MNQLKKVSPVSSNAVRKLSQYPLELSAEHWKAVMQLKGIIKGNPPVMKIRGTKSFRSIEYCDSNYATNKEDDRTSINGNILTLGGSIVSCSGHKQDGTTLSSSEAEYVSKTHCAQEVRYVQQVVEELEKKRKKLRAWIFGDNNGAIFMANNNHVGQRTKHIDVRYHYIRDQVQEGHIKVMKIEGENNPSDVLTKNVVEKIHNKHGPEIQNGCFEHAIELLRAANRSREDVESTPDLDTDSSDVDGNPKPNMVEGLVGLTHGVGVGSAVGVAVGWPSKVTNLEAPHNSGFLWRLRRIESRGDHCCAIKREIPKNKIITKSRRFILMQS